MQLFSFSFAGLLLISVSNIGVASNDKEAVIAFEHARIITAMDQTVLEDSTLLVRGEMIEQIGESAHIEIPDNATRIDVSGMTIVPAFIDTHVHTNQSEEELLEDLVGLATFGVGTVASLGVDTDDAPYNMRHKVIDGAARFLTAGRGITAPEVGRETAPYWVESEKEARLAVRENVVRGVDLIKIWVDDRNGTVPKLGYDLYSAVIEEAHKNQLIVAAHIYTLNDAKNVLRAGVDALAHNVRDLEIDDEFINLLSM